MVYKSFIPELCFQKFCGDLSGNVCADMYGTLAISTSLVISLGMVGALSIVRYRTAVKDPMDLFVSFLSITTGITAGAEMYPWFGEQRSL